MKQPNGIYSKLSPVYTILHTIEDAENALKHQRNSACERNAGTNFTDDIQL